MKILVVDDSKLARMAMAKALNAVRPEWTRIEAGSADEALARKFASPEYFAVSECVPSVRTPGATAN